MFSPLRYELVWFIKCSKYWKIHITDFLKVSREQVSKPMSQPGLKPRTFLLWDYSTNHCTIVTLEKQIRVVISLDYKCVGIKAFCFHHSCPICHLMVCIWRGQTPELGTPHTLRHAFKSCDWLTQKKKKKCTFGNNGQRMDSEIKQA